MGAYRVAHAPRLSSAKFHPTSFAVVLGAATLAAIGVGLYPDIASAVEAMAFGSEEVQPNPAHRRLLEVHGWIAAFE
jgi:ribulose kinase